jgi:excisionase family DNA binding protein
MPDRITSWSDLPVMVPLLLAAQTIGVSRSTLYNVIAAGDIRVRRVGVGRVFITKTELRRYCEGKFVLERVGDTP